jgi:hypothetical protein
MAMARAQLFRTIVAVIAAVGLAGLAWPVGFLVAALGFGMMPQGLFGSPEIRTALLFVFVGLVLLGAPVVLAALIARRSRSKVGWVVGAGWLLLAGVFLGFAATADLVGGWFTTPELF